MPSSFSWRALGMVSPVQNQNPYGTCWAFATVAGLEASWLRRHREIVDLSEQDLINCNCRPCNGPNTPGWTSAGDKLLNTGLESEEVLSYKGDGAVKPCSASKVKTNCGPCNSDTLRPYRAEEYVVLDPDQDDLTPVDVPALKKALLEHGPVVVKMHIPAGSKIGSHDGVSVFRETVPLVYDDPSTPGNERNNGAHIVLVTGWDDARQAWEIKNSWGTAWGKGGFGWIGYGSNKIGMGAWWLRAWAPALRVTAVWRKETADEIQVYGWSYDNYRARYDRLWAQGYRLHALETAVVDGEVVYSAVWRKGAVPEIQVYGWTFEDYQKKYDELWSKGWRLFLLSNYVIKGQVRYTAVWRKGTDAEKQSYGRTFNGFKTKYDQLWTQGWRLHLLSNYVVKGQVRYNAVWRKGNDAEIQSFGTGYADYRKKYDELWAKGWRLHLLNNHVVKGQVLYNAVWRKSTKPEIQVYSWEYDDFREKDATLRSQGWRIAMLNTYALG
jgi:C1A family cysteine protease